MIVTVSVEVRSSLSVTVSVKIWVTSAAPSASVSAVKVGLTTVAEGLKVTAPASPSRPGPGILRNAYAFVNYRIAAVKGHRLTRDNRLGIAGFRGQSQKRDLTVTLTSSSWVRHLHPSRSG